MTPKNITSLLVAGMIIAVAFLVGGDFSVYLNPAGLLLVLGGTLTGVFLAFPAATLSGLWEQLSGLRSRKTLNQRSLVTTFVKLARLQRSDGVRQVEDAARATGNAFLEMGVAMVNDEVPAPAIRERLEQEFDFFLSQRESQRAVLNLMGRLAPAFGLAGTMVGLIRMLHSVKDPSAVAEGMSVALLSTFYGLMLANLVILPLEKKLSERNRAEAVEMTLVLEGILGLAAGLNGAAMEARLSSFRFAEGGESVTAPPEAAPPASPAAAGARPWVRNIRGLAPMTRSAGHES